MKRVLIVDDRDDNRDLLRTLLKGHGYEVEEARHGAEALAKARQSPPDVVVSDLLMPVMDGYTLLRQWKADAQLTGVPFVIYTSTYTDPRDEQLARDLGGDEFIVKPAEPEVFMALLQRVLAATAPAPARPPVADAGVALEAYNAALVRKLEAKAEELERRVAEREAALQSLAASEARYRSLFENSMDMILLTRADGSVLAANPAACRGFGLSEAELCARGRADLVDPADPRLPALLAERAAGGTVRGELTMIRDDDSRFPVELTSIVYGDGSGGQVTASILRDIGGRLRVEAELRATIARLVDLQAALDAHAQVTMTDAEGRITYANELFCRISGYTPPEVLGRTHAVINSRTHPPAFFANLWQTISAGRIWRGEICNRAKDASLYWVDATIYPFLDAEGRPIQYAAIRTDISERKRAEAARAELESQLRQVQKMEAVGMLASGIAHDFNNVLGAMLGYLAMAEDDARLGQPVAEHLAQIRMAGQRARVLVQRILAFSRQQPMTLKVQALQPLLQETQALLRGTLPAGVALELRMAAETWPVRADATQVQQVLLNLATNAWHALPQGRGRVEIGLDFVALPQDRPLPAGLPPGRYAHLWVADNGCGMDDATRARAFEPFFTTKPVGQGTGLGLAAVHGAVELHGGAVALDSVPGQGTTVHVLLPLADGAAVASTAASAGGCQAQPCGNLRVLYVDDDETLATLAERLLWRAGCRPVVFTDAALALEAVRADPRAFDVVVTDYQMPRMSGLDFAVAVGEVAPTLPVIIGSGYIDADLQAASARVGVCELLHKEMLAEHLVPALVRAVAAAHETPAAPGTG
ncbi:MAG: response regulator [Burkholderiaceae bacterium]|nr:response regulator [Burkholderiaceae bacterium]